MLTAIATIHRVNLTPPQKATWDRARAWLIKESENDDWLVFIANTFIEATAHDLQLAACGVIQWKMVNCHTKADKAAADDLVAAINAALKTAGEEREVIEAVKPGCLF